MQSSISYVEADDEAVADEDVADEEVVDVEVDDDDVADSVSVSLVVSGDEDSAPTYDTSTVSIVKSTHTVSIKV